jgi:hypothetical protein
VPKTGSQRHGWQSIQPHRSGGGWIEMRFQRTPLIIGNVGGLCGKIEKKLCRCTVAIICGIPLFLDSAPSRGLCEIYGKVIATIIFCSHVFAVF